MYHWILKLVRLNMEAANETSKTEIQVSKFRSNVFKQASLSLKIFLPLIYPKYIHDMYIFIFISCVCIYIYSIYVYICPLGTNISHPKAVRKMSFLSHW